MTVFRLESSIRNYDWGKTTGLSSVLGTRPSGEPEAELWMGAHPGAPSKTSATGVDTSDLRTLLEQNPDFVGESRAELPYLFKVLAADRPLSLQVHPNRAQAEEGYRREEALGVSRDAPFRNYKDANHKPELLYALTDFSALCGFLPSVKMIQRLEHYGVGSESSSLDEALDSLRANSAPSNLSRLFESFFSLSHTELKKSLSKARQVAEKDAVNSFDPQLKRFNSHLLAIHEAYGTDPGVLAALTLHFVEMREGEAIYLPAGVPHSYLEGVGLEIMASSDNVLRAGLTTKHVDVPELMKTVRFEAQEPRLVSPSLKGETGTTESRFRTEAEEFELSLITLGQGGRFRARGPDILLVLEGKIEVAADGRVLRLSQGEQAFCAGDDDYHVFGSGRFARASVPRDDEAASLSAADLLKVQA